MVAPKTGKGRSMIRPVLFASACSAALIAVPAYAQSTADASAEVQVREDAAATAGGDTATNIVVTGSRAIRDGSQAPTPVTVMAAEDLAKAQPGLIGEAPNQLPSFRGSTRPAGAFTGAVGPQSGSYLNLRNLGVQRTLVLIDGRRAAPSSRDGSTDINLFPQELVKRVDIVTGGASAAYEAASRTTTTGRLK